MHNITIPRTYASKILKIKNFQKTLKSKTQNEILDLYISSHKIESILAIGLEVFERILSISLYDVQIYAALSMCEGKIVEMKTGEGKSYVSILVSLVRHKFGKVYIVTINDTLAQRDYENSVELFDFLNIKSTYALYQQNYKYDKSVYESDIVFSAVSRLIFDFLYDKENYIFDNIIVDEIDYTLIDNANSQFSLSKQALLPLNEKNYPFNEYLVANEIQKEFRGKFIPYITDDFISLRKNNADYYFVDDYQTIFFTAEGMLKIKQIVKEKNLPSLQDFYFALFYTIQAQKQYVYNRDYIVIDKKIVLINKNNGRLMHNSQKEKGLQIALELKENCPINQANGATETISMQLFFLLFNFITGMSGTVDFSKNEFKSNFKTNTSVIPTNLPIKRKDFKDKKFYTKEEKFAFALSLIHDYQNEPFLIVLENEKETLEFSDFLKNNKITFSLLNNHNIEEENMIIKNYENENQIVVTTNLLGRGTDIKITEEAENKNGLIVVLLDKFKNKRIENQIKGRSGRQGKKGISFCVYSLEDLFFYSLEKKYLKKIKNTFNKKSSQLYIDKMQKHILSQEESQRYSILQIDKMLYSYFNKLEFLYLKENIGKNIFKKIKKKNKSLFEKYKAFERENSKELTTKLFKIIFKEVLLSTKDDLYKQILDIALSMNIAVLNDMKTEYLFLDYIEPSLIDYENKVIVQTLEYLISLKQEAI